MEVKKSKFIISNTDVNKCPEGDKHEYAFIGRSNVGKSSLINMLTRHNGLAMTSATPGKTLLINHFLINDSWYIVDLPGYGYAKAGKHMRENLSRIIKSYILNRWQMTNLFLLVDSRHSPQKIDTDFMEWLAENQIPFSIVFTKIDKLGSAVGKKKVEEYCNTLLKSWEELPPVFVTSSENGKGREDILNYIEKLNKIPISSL